MKALLSYGLLCLALGGCAATATKITNVHLGMTKQQVIAVMGPPTSVSAQGDTEYLRYMLSESGRAEYRGVRAPYFVKLIDGKVESFGRVGDFDSTKPPTIRIEQ